MLTAVPTDARDRHGRVRPGRWTYLEAEDEKRALQRGDDFRHPQLRRETFLRFYEFHVKHRAHPGAVYYLMPYLARARDWDDEQRLWFAFINGNTQNPVTSWLIMRRFPTLQATGIGALDQWFAAEYRRLDFDTDRRHHKRAFPACVEAYRRLTGGRQAAYFARHMTVTDPRGSFEALWQEVMQRFPYFGRLSTFSYLEYLRIMGLPLECSTLFLDDRSGSRSHRNGLCKVLGRDDLDWHDSNPGFDGHYAPDVLDWLEAEGRQLLEEATGRMAGKPYAADVGYFTLESALCTYKSWHRPNRRYPNVYNDMGRDRIERAERQWGERLELFWQARAERLPTHLRVEANPADPGCCPAKQNHYRETGQVVMMDEDWPCFANDFNDAINRAQESA